MVDFFADLWHFEMHIQKWNNVKNFITISLRCLHDNTGSGNGLVPTRQQAKTSINVGNTACKISQISADRNVPCSGIIMCMHPANERRRYSVTSFLIGWAHAQNDPSQWETMLHCNIVSHWLGIYTNDPWDVMSYTSSRPLRCKHPSLLGSLTIN